MTENLVDALSSAVSEGIMSEPSLFPLPKSFPFYIALSKVKTKDGCTKADNAMGTRISTGCAKNPEQAKFLALTEAVERYSIQFSNNNPSSSTACETTASSPLVTRTGNITIGSPPPFPENSSIGSACGATYEDACTRAILEHLEHTFISRQRTGRITFEDVCVDEFEESREIAYWLKTQLRSLSLAVHLDEAGFCVVASSCSDTDGKRRTVGTAAALEPQVAIIKAIQEALLFWRNMLQLELNCITVSSLNHNDQTALEIYRGFRHDPRWPATRLSSVRSAPQKNQANVPHARLMAKLVELTGSQVHIFDMTDPKLNIPVVKILLD